MLENTDAEEIVRFPASADELFFTISESGLPVKI